MTKRQLLKELANETYVRLGVSTVCNGIGVFAIKEIPEGVDPFENCRRIDKWHRLTEEEVNALPDTVGELIRDMFVKEEGKFYVPEFGANQIDCSFYINHSKDSNMKPEKLGEAFIAKRLIKCGEELTVDYDEYDEGEHNY